MGEQLQMSKLRAGTVRRAVPAAAGLATQGWPQGWLATGLATLRREPPLPRTPGGLALLGAELGPLSAPGTALELGLLFRATACAAGSRHSAAVDSTAAGSVPPLRCSPDAMQELGAEYRKFFAVLDVAFMPYRMYTKVKSAYYEENIAQNRSSCRQLGRDPHQQLWFGYRQRVIDTADGPMLMIDTAAAAM